LSIEQIYVILVLFIPLILVFLDKLREDVAALLMAALLGLAQTLGLGVLGPANTPAAATKAIEGLGTPEVITLMALFIVTRTLDKYGLTRWLAGQMLSLGGRSERRLIAIFAVSGAILSLFMNTLAAGALLLPSAQFVCAKTGIKPSKLLIPIAYGTMLGGAATYLTTANIVVSGLLPLANPPQPSLGFLSFTPTGGLVAIAGLAFLILVGPKLLPSRELNPNTHIDATTKAEVLLNEEGNSNLLTTDASDDPGINRAPAMKTLFVASCALLAMFVGLPVELATLAAVVGLLLLRLINPEEAYSAIKWRAIFLIAGTLSVSQAMIQTGLAASIGQLVVGWVAPWGAMGLVVGSYLLSAVLTQIMGGQISPLVVGPITISAAIHLGVNAQAIAVVTAIAGSVSFITPLSHPVNILMIAPANYKFSDFVRSGFLLTVVCFVALLVAVPFFWHLGGSAQ